MIKRIFFLCVMVLIFTQMTAQERVLSGQIVEVGNNTPIPYATLIIKNTIYGTQADEKGKYVLKLPEGYEQDSISVSSLSYKEKIFAVKEMTKNQRIELELNSNILAEVVVYPIDPKDILKKAVENLDKNHKTKELIEQQFFARELFFDNGKCFRAAESIGKNVYNVTIPKFKLKETTLKKNLKARGIQDSAKLWVFNDMFRMKRDTISFDEPVGQIVSGFDLISIFGRKNEEGKNEKKKSKGTEINMNVKPELKYNGTVKMRGRTTHRILIDFLHKKKTIIKGQVLIDSATYAFSQVQLANQNVDLFKEFVPWYLKGMLRLLGYKPVINRLSMMNSYAMGEGGKWYKYYDYYRFGGSIKKRKRTLDGYAETECFYNSPKKFQEDATAFFEKNKKDRKDFKEAVVTSFDDEQFWKPFKGYPTPEKVKTLVDEIHRHNANFKGSIGYNKKESRKRRREERRKKRK